MNRNTKLNKTSLTREKGNSKITTTPNCDHASSQIYRDRKTSSRNFVNLRIAYPATLTAAVAKVSEYIPTLTQSLHARSRDVTARRSSRDFFWTNSESVKT
jgi:hypothetical protein